MKKILYILIAGGFLFASCDKVENPYPVQEATELDYSLYPDGDSAYYWANAAPIFTANGNTLRNVVIEDFTGHKCTYCPIAADTAKAIHEDYPNRVFVATIHAGPTGIGGFQTTSTEFPVDWTNPDGVAIGLHFGSIPGTSFTANPRGAVNRILDGDQHTVGVYSFRSMTEAALPTALKVNLQSAVNYYPSTRGVFLHTEVDVLDQSIPNQLYTVVYLIEDSIIGKQKMPNNSTNESYVHREVLRDCIGSDWQGRKILPENAINDKYYFNYSFKLDDIYDATNMSFLIYVRDAVTEEIYQVIHQDIE